MTTKPCISPSRESDCHRRVIEAARQEFMKDGFRGASVDRIAAAAGVAKQTLYNHFPSKEALFEETIRTGVRDIVVGLADASGSLRDRLVAYAGGLRAKMLSPEGLAWFRTFITDLPRNPELSAMVWREGPQETRRHLAELLADAMERNELRRDSPEFAAEMFNGMLIHADRTRALMGQPLDLTDDSIRVAEIVACFLRAYRPE